MSLRYCRSSCSAGYAGREGTRGYKVFLPLAGKTHRVLANIRRIISCCQCRSPVGFYLSSRRNFHRGAQRKSGAAAVRAAGAAEEENFSRSSLPEARSALAKIGRTISCCQRRVPAGFFDQRANLQSPVQRQTGTAAVRAAAVPERRRTSADVRCSCRRQKYFTSWNQYRPDSSGADVGFSLPSLTA